MKGVNHLPSPEKIRAGLPTDTIFGRILVEASTGSTNADLAAMARAGEPEGTALIAMEQTAGRGRLDRTWVSPPGASVSLSVLLQPKPDFQQWGWLSILAGMAVSSALRDHAPDPASVSLKWPNDVLIGGAKVCGILSERIERPDGACAVVGMGVNLELTREQLPVPTATSLFLEGFDVDPEVLIAGVLAQFERWYRAWALQGSLREQYEQICSSIGAALTITLDGAHKVTGTGRGVDRFGRLQVATAVGIETFAVGDVVHARLDALT